MVTALEFTPTPQQEDIFAAAISSRTSLMITAYAGTGKTTTLEQLSRHLPIEGTLALAFNVKIKNELEKRFPKHFSVLTLNGLGHRAWGKYIGKGLIVEPKKLSNIITKNLRKNTAPAEWWEGLRQLINTAMSWGLVPGEFKYTKSLTKDNDENWQQIIDLNFIDLPSDAISIARECLTESIVVGKLNGVISYDEQVYLPVVFGAGFPRFSLVLVDEAQDLSPLNHIQIKRCAADRLIVVGDPKQAIYSFRGADSSSMEKLREIRTEWIDLPLSCTFRCPKSVVQRQLSHAPEFTALPAAAEGQVHRWDIAEGKEKEWDWNRVQDLSKNKPTTYAVICRNNAPLLKMAFTLIRNGIPPLLLGSEIGNNLVKLVKKILPLDKIPPSECRRLILTWQDQEEAKAQEKDQEEKIGIIKDRAHCLLAVMDFAQARNSKELISALEDLFNRKTGSVHLTTGHKAKGLEWDSVLHLDPWRVPSKYAKSAAQKGDNRQLVQEFNLRYVIETRTKHTLILANLKDFSGVSDPTEEDG